MRWPFHSDKGFRDPYGGLADLAWGVFAGAAVVPGGGCFLGRSGGVGGGGSGPVAGVPLGGGGSGRCPSVALFLFPSGDPGRGRPSGGPLVAFSLLPGRGGGGWMGVLRHRPRRAVVQRTDPCGLAWRPGSPPRSVPAHRRRGSRRDRMAPSAGIISARADPRRAELQADSWQPPRAGFDCWCSTGLATGCCPKPGAAPGTRRASSPQGLYQPLADRARPGDPPPPRRGSGRS